MNLKDLINRAVVSAKNGSKKLRILQVQILGGDIRESVEHFEPYGFTSEIHPGAEAVAISLGGDRDQTLAIVVTDRRYRPTGLKDGEVCIFDDLDRKIFLSRDGIRVEGVSSPVTVSTSASVTVDAPLTKCTGNLEVQGNIVAKGEVKDKGGSYSMSGMRATYNGHTHNAGPAPDQKM
ncbi:phage baseplate assembly protein V [Turicimonas muris]|uniref:phage baseplate assembly protein V n=1 Tax=Turicimonas muris TaxID=1796652 RepID=UPI0026755291|nr:phage baseplate assembly protein V [Turicimonas muris]MBS4768127.1 phage baseplate assembly protein V [Burkholderiales bacterium]